MKIRVLLAPHHVDELYFAGKTTVVIDVLRATTVIGVALDNGAREVIPVSTVDFAMKVSGNAFRSQTLLGGERNTKMIEGFNLGNSPSEYTPEMVSGRSVILYTSNGSKAIVKAKFSESLFICSFNNLTAVANHVLKLQTDLHILCAGSNGMFCIEDTVCAGRLISEIEKHNSFIELSDSARASLILNKSFGKNLTKMMKESEHGMKLIDNGFEKDIRFCAKVDILNLVPYFNSGVIKTLESSN